jgi:hypothetical protein
MYEGACPPRGILRSRVCCWWRHDDGGRVWREKVEAREKQIEGPEESYISEANAGCPNRQRQSRECFAGG